jgi:hypothetical protein
MRPANENCDIPPIKGGAPGEGGDAVFVGGAVRSADADQLDFLSLPLVGLIGAARTAHEGATKYGRHNYLSGMPVHVCLNHAMRHIVMYAMGDRSEPHLAHLTWNAMTAQQSEVLHPYLNDTHMPGPGYTLTPEMLYRLGEDAPGLARLRKNPKWKEAVGAWLIDELPEVARIVSQRYAELGANEDDDD